LSLNLAVLNILPFPALDGGRVLFLLIEKVRRKRNNQKVEQIVNGVGFALLLLLMVAVTVQDIIRK
jgi:regulator of sigma E protease